MGDYQILFRLFSKILIARFPEFFGTGEKIPIEIPLQHSDHRSLKQVRRGYRGAGSSEGDQDDRADKPLLDRAIRQDDSENRGFICSGSPRSIPAPPALHLRQPGSTTLAEHVRTETRAVGGSDTRVPEPLSNVIRDLSLTRYHQ
ncbi:MAG: hypothetical protein D5R96_06550 [Methanocalculus sp. MSAO_Arc2]|nr:MAG: hypothetical protein D5R96_06550 [Methanocalculus sp. MSAO_Arc2]